MNGDMNDDMKGIVNGKSNVENSQTEVVVISTGKAVRQELILPFFPVFSGTAVVGCVLGCGSAVLVLVVVKHLRRRSKSRNATNAGNILKRYS